MSPLEIHLDSSCEEYYFTSQVLANGTINLLTFEGYFTGTVNMFLPLIVARLQKYLDKACLIDGVYHVICTVNALLFISKDYWLAT